MILRDILRDIFMRYLYEMFFMIPLFFIAVLSKWCAKHGQVIAARGNAAQNG